MLHLGTQHDVGHSGSQPLDDCRHVRIAFIDVGGHVMVKKNMGKMFSKMTHLNPIKNKTMY